MRHVATAFVDLTYLCCFSFNYWCWQLLVWCTATSSHLLNEEPHQAIHLHTSNHWVQPRWLKKDQPFPFLTLTFAQKATAVGLLFPTATPRAFVQERWQTGSSEQQSLSGPKRLYPAGKYSVASQSPASALSRGMCAPQ